MRLLAALLALACATSLRAQGFEETTPSPATSPARVAPKPAEADPGFGRLRSISYFFTDVRTSENRPEDGDLRAELRDLIELELRRAGMTPRELPSVNPDASAPQLIIDVRFDRGLGRYSAVVAVAVRDEATVRPDPEGDYRFTVTVPASVEVGRVYQWRAVVTSGGDVVAVSQTRSSLVR